MIKKAKLIANSFVVISIFATIFSACEKTDLQKPNSTVLNQSLNSDEISFSKEASNLKLTLRPGPKHGQDVYFDKDQGVESDNLNYVPELCANSWTINGSLYRSGFYIRFDSLMLVPSGSHVVSAKLYLYGLSNSLSTPQGDNGDNACYVDRVISEWDQSTLTYLNRPKNSIDHSVTMAASTSQWNYNAVVDVTSYVSYFVEKPSENYGFYIHLIDQAQYRSMVFGSSEQSDKNFRPKLVVTYQ
ncbi:MAG: DNRLRE domain-containing protein [Parafilimonas sp.]